MSNNLLDTEINSIINTTLVINKTYDYVIIGGGPTALTLAWYLSKIKKNILIIEKDSVLGGCHRVERIDGLFTEHGPRVYSNAYLNFVELLKDMNLNFDDLFTEYNFDLSNIGDKTFKNFKITEILSFVLSILLLSLNPSYGKDISMDEHMKNYNFSNETQDYIERLCRLTDGASSKKYTLFQFLQLINQQSLYKLYQPKLPNDRGLIYEWEQALRNKGVNILLNSEVIKMDEKSNNLIANILIKNNKTNEEFTINSKNYILTIPPRAQLKLLLNSPSVQNAFGNINEFNKWTQENSYFDYIPITLHFKNKINLPKIWGFPASEWGVAFIVLSNYMKFNDKIELENSQTVISAAISITDKKSSFTNKTADESDIKELYNEVLRQLRLSYPDLPIPDRMILSPKVYKDEVKNRWINLDSAYVLTNENIHLPSKSILYKNLYSVGTHNGNSKYYFTSIESAVSNALVFVHEMNPEIKNKYPIKETFQITTFIFFILLVLISYILYILKKKYYK
jgi:hypothetical protein